MTYLIRHAESVKNVQNLPCFADKELTEAGRLSATLIAKQLKYPLSKYRIFVSPFKRTIQTAVYMGAENFTICPELREIVQLESAASPSYQLENGQIFKAESESDFLNRMYDAYFKYHDDDSIIISHGSPIQVLKSLMSGQVIDKVPKWDDSVQYATPYFYPKLYTYKYQRFKITCDTCFIQNNSVLVIRRTCDPAKGELAIPGGNLLINETLFDCARREFLEETSLSFSTNEVIRTVQADNPRRIFDQERAINFIFFVKSNNLTAPTLNAESDAYLFVPKENIINGNIKLAFDHEIIAECLKTI